MSASKERPLWAQLPKSARVVVERLVAGRSRRAAAGVGFSPGFASRLLADGRRVFVKAVDVEAWPEEAMTYRVEVQTAASLPPTAPAPRFLGVGR